MILLATATGSALRLKLWLASAKPLSEIVKHSETVSSDVLTDPTLARPLGKIRVLLVGVDDYERVQRSDSIGLATFDEESRSLRFLSIPRDSRVSIPGHGLQKVNHAYAYGGIDLLKETLCQFLDVDIDYYIVLGFGTFPKVIDLIGGIDIDVEKRLVYRDRSQNLNINIQAGRQHLDGKTALEYVRFRNDPRGDIGRVQRQQRFLSVLLDKLKSPAIWVKIPNLVSEVLSGVNTDLTSDAILSLAAFSYALPPGHVEFHMASGRDATINGLSYWLVDINAVSNWLRGGLPLPVSPDPETSFSSN